MMRRLAVGGAALATGVGLALAAPLAGSAGATSAHAAPKVIEPCPVHELLSFSSTGITVWVGCDGHGFIPYP